MRTTTDISDIIGSKEEDPDTTIASLFVSGVMLFICVVCCKAGRAICECLKSYLLQALRCTCCDDVSCDCSACLKTIHQVRETLASRVTEYWERGRSNSRNNANTEAPSTGTSPPDRLLLDDHSIHLSLHEDYSNPSPTHIPPPSYGSVVTASLQPPPSYEEFMSVGSSAINANTGAPSPDGVLANTLRPVEYDSDDSFVSAESYSHVHSTQEIPTSFDSNVTLPTQPSPSYEDFQRIDVSSTTNNSTWTPSSYSFPLPPIDDNRDDSFTNADSSDLAHSDQGPPPAYDSIVSDPTLPPPSYEEVQGTAGSGSTSNANVRWSPTAPSPSTINDYFINSSMNEDDPRTSLTLGPPLFFQSTTV